MNKSTNKSQKTRTNHNSKRRNNGRPGMDNTTMRKTDVESKDCRVVSSSNDPSWYTRNNQLALDAGRLSFTWPLGAPVDLNAGRYKADATPIAFPGLCSVLTLPSIGVSQDNSSPVNTAARNIYSFVRHANSGHANYDSPDLMLYLLAMDNLYSVYAFMARTYGTLSLYSQRNRYVPEMVVRASGFDFDDLIKHIADLRYFINTCAVKIGSLCAPSSMPYFTRHQWLYSGIYADSPDPKSQMYMYVPQGFYQYNELQGAGKLEYKAWYNESTPKTFDDLVQYVNEMIAVIIESEDMNIMSGDILKAFGAEGVFKLSQISESYTVVPMYNAEVLMQFQNTIPVNGLTFGDGNLDITQDPTTGAILFNPKQNTSYWGNEMNRIMTGMSESPSPEEVLVNSRLMFAAKTGSESKSGAIVTFYFDALGSEYCPYAYFWFWTFDASGKRTPDYVAAGGITTGTSPKSRAVASIFSKHPLEYVVDNATATDKSTISLIGVTGNFDNYTIVGVHELAKLHQTALLSMFSVPQLGSWQG